MAREVKKAVCPLCHKVFENTRPEQSVRLHMERKHKQRWTGEGYVPIDSIEQPYSNEYRLLDPNDPWERQLMAHGLHEIQEVPGVAREDWEVR